MKRNICLGVLLSALLMLMDLGDVAVAQNNRVNMDRCMRMRVGDSELLMISMPSRSEDVVGVKICFGGDSVKEMQTQVVDERGEDRYMEFRVERGQEIRIYGAVKSLWLLGRLDSLDVSGNGDLEDLVCRGCGLKWLNVEGNSRMKMLLCGLNDLERLDVGDCKDLVILAFHKNRVGEIDVSGCRKLNTLGCMGNGLRSLDVSRNRKLEVLNCGGNGLTSLDVSRNGKLELLNCRGNRLSELDLSGNGRLEDLMCEGNLLVHLDLSRNMELGNLNCSDNRLVDLKVDGLVKLKDLECTGNALDGVGWKRLFGGLPNRMGCAEMGVLKVCEDCEEATMLKRMGDELLGAKGWTLDVYDLERK